MAVPYSNIQPTSDVGLQTAPYQTDFSFLTQGLDKSNQQYEQGLAQVKNDYSSILNTQVTDDANIEKKAEYNRQIQQGLKKVATTDLSLPQNVQQAENLYAPFCKYTILLQDAGLTKKAQNNLQRAQAVENSTDEDVRKTFDSRYVELVQLQLDRLKNAKRDPSEYKDLEINDWIPVNSVTNHLNDVQETDKFAVTYDILDNKGQKLTVTNGPATVPAFTTYGDSQVGTEFNAQYNMLGKLAKERAIYQYRQIHPDATRNQAMSEVTAPLYNQTLSEYENKVKTYQAVIATNQEELNKIKQTVSGQPGKVPIPVQTYNIQRLESQLGQYHQRAKEVYKQYRELQTPDGYQNVVNHPELIYGQQYRNEEINKWALGKAGQQTQKVDEDKSFWNNATLRYNYHQTDVTENHYKNQDAAAAQQLGINAFDSETARMKVKGDYPWLFTADGTYNALGSRSGGYATNEQYHIDDIASTNLHKQQLFTSAVSGTYIPTGLASILRSVPKEIASSEEVLAFSSYMNKSLTGGEGTAAEKGSYNKLAIWLHEQTGLPTDNIQHTNEAFLSYVPRYINTAKGNGAMTAAEADRLQDSYIKIKDNIDEYKKDDAQRNVNLQNYIKTPEGQKLQHLIRPDGQGGVRYVTAQDMVPEMSEIDLVPVGAGEDKHLSAHETAALYRDGKLAPDTAGYISVDGKKYVITGFNGHTKNNSGIAVPMNMMTQWYRHIADKYGKPGELEQNIKTLEQKTVRGTSLYNKNQGIMGTRDIVPHSDIKSPGTMALREDVQAGQFSGMYDILGGNKPLTGEQTQVIQSVVNDPKLTDYIGQEHLYLELSPEGGPATEIQFRVFGADEKVPQAIKNFSGKRIIIEHSPGHGATYNKLYPKGEDFSWHPLNNGKTISSDPIENSTNHGWYQIIPSQGHAVIVGEVMTKDPVIGEQSTAAINYPVSLANQNPEKIEQTVKDKFRQNGRDYMKNADYYRLHHNKQ